MPVRSGLMAVILLACVAPLARAQLDQDDSGGGKLGQTETQRWRFGMIVKANGGAFKSLVGTVTVPMDWPEQQVRIVGQDLSPGVKVTYKTIDGTVKQMTARIPSVAAGNEARAIITCEIARAAQLPPERTDRYVLPDPKTLDRGLQVYLNPSPYIESTHPTIKALAKEVGTDRKQAWDRVKAIYDGVRAKITYQKDSPPASTLSTLEKGVGDCDEMSSLFVAICRAAGVPARLVRVPKHCYAEFYLQDEQGQGHWFPCQPSGDEAFGGIPQRDVIVQKGDNFRITMLDLRSKRPKNDAVRFIPENLTGLPAGKAGGGQPQMTLICEPAN